MPDRNVIQELLPHLSASEWRSSREVAQRSCWSESTVRRCLTIAASVGIVRCQYVQKAGDRVMNPQPTYRLKERSA